MCRTILNAAAESKSDKVKKGRRMVQEDPQLNCVISLIESFSGSGSAVHPKMEKVKSLALEHFTPAAGEETTSLGNGPSQSRMMIFATFREIVDELVMFLNEEQPLIRASRFIGQGTAKGQKGMTQKEQLSVNDDSYSV